jgi:hypothetical protein
MILQYGKINGTADKDENGNYFDPYSNVKKKILVIFFY